MTSPPSHTAAPPPSRAVARMVATVLALVLGAGVTAIGYRLASGGPSTQLGLWRSGAGTNPSLSGANSFGVSQQILTDFATPGGSTGTFTNYSVPSTPLRISLAVGDLNASQANAIGSALVSAGHADSIIRVMVEQNQCTWNTSWNESHFTTGAQYVAAFQSVVTELRAVPGQAFKFVWNPNAGEGNNCNGETTQQTWPGASFVDYVGVDVYDFGGYQANTQEIVDFATGHPLPGWPQLSTPLPLAFPEWGLNGTDDTTFMSYMIGQIQNPANNVAFQSYFSCGPSQGCSQPNSDLTQFPNSKAAFTAAFSGTGTTTTTNPDPTSTTIPPGTPHVMLVLMENKNYTDVIGGAGQPFTNSLATNYGLATQSYAFGHPSLPNYLDLISGSNQAVTDDNPPSSHSFPNVITLADQLNSAGVTEKAYAENLPSDPTNDSGEYAVRHFPWEYFPNTKMPIAPSSSLVTDLNSGSAPSFVWYTPNLINDEHDGTPAQGDAFLSSFIPAVQATSWYKAGGQIIITWDESLNDNTNGGGHVPTIVVSAALKAAPQQSTTHVDTQGILHSIESVYGVAPLGGSSADGTLGGLLTASAVVPPPPTTTTTAPSGTTTTTVPGSTTTLPSGVPGAPTIDVVTITSGTGANVLWTNPPGALGDDIYLDGTDKAHQIGYPGGGTSPPTPVTNNFNLTTTTGTHTVYVSAYNSHGEGPKSPGVTFTLVSSPPPTTTTTVPPTTTTTAPVRTIKEPNGTTLHENPDGTVTWTSP